MTAADRPIGPTVSGDEATFPSRTPTVGDHLVLEPMQLSHAKELFPIVGAPENAWLWDYMLTAPPTSVEAYSEYLDKCIKTPHSQFFVLRNKHTRQALGSISYLNIDTINRKVEIGNVLFIPQIQGTAISTEAQYLMMNTALSELGYRRLEWKCNNLNEPSKKAATRLGYKFEGIFRKHLIVKGRNRDTAWFSIIDEEWPSIKNGLDQWLSEANFDVNGKQKKRLQDLIQQVL